MNKITLFAMLLSAVLPLWAWEGIGFDREFLFKTPEVFPAERSNFPFADDATIHPLFFAGLPFQGKPTRIFAWYGVPDDGQQKHPAIVLVHGGGGTAFYEWVKRWNQRGYAAIAIDTNGSIPLKPWEGGKTSMKHPDGGPIQPFTLATLPDQWTTQAVSAVILAHSLLRSFPEIDRDKIGITGISWGGFLTCIAIGIDDRFKYAIPVYGCGFIGEGSMFIPQLDALEQQKTCAKQQWLDAFDPSHYLPQAAMPILFITGSNDKAYHLTSWMRSTLLPTGCVQRMTSPRIGHSHQSGDLPEVKSFADFHSGKGSGLPQIISAKISGNQLLIEAQNGVTAELFYTVDPLRPVRAWKSKSVDCTQKNISAEIPAESKSCFLNVTNANGSVSTQVFEL